jgi:hypothetical protein
MVPLPSQALAPGPGGQKFWRRGLGYSALLRMASCLCFLQSVQHSPAAAEAGAAVAWTTTPRFPHSRTVRNNSCCLLITPYVVFCYSNTS